MGKRATNGIQGNKAWVNKTAGITFVDSVDMI